MAHFAELELKQDPTGFTTDDKYIVKRVVVVGNDIPAANGTLEQHDMHEDGEFHCKKLFGGGIWKQTSYNGNIRKNFAGIGHTYDEDRNAFISPKPTQYPSWVLNETTCQWEAPIAKPDDETETKRYGWNEETQQWDVYTHTYVYNEETQQWDLIDNSE